MSNGYLDCRVNGVLAHPCSWFGSGVSLTLPFALTSGTQYLFSIGTRGNDLSASTLEGLDLTAAGTYDCSIVTGSSPATEQKIISYDVLPPAFNKFWVWSPNKNIYNPSSDVDAGLTFFRIYFTPS